jgi:hypothetical protein
MKYYIVGKTSEKGPTYEDSGDLNSYYELGWELMMTHVRVKKMKHLGIIKDEDVVVTTNDERKFLYTTEFNNVISWSEFINLGINNNIVDLVNLSISENHQDMINDVIQDNDLINKLCSFEIDSETKLKIKDKFVCLQFRKRLHSSERNVDEGEFKNIVNLITENYGLDVYIMGLGSEMFCDNEKIFYVNLQQFTTLINDENCVLFYSTMSGPAHLSNFFTSKKTKHIVNDISNCRGNSSLKNHPLYMGDIFNYVKANIEIIPYYQNINFYKSILTNLLN